MYPVALVLMNMMLVELMMFVIQRVLEVEKLTLLDSNTVIHPNPFSFLQPQTPLASAIPLALSWHTTNKPRANGSLVNRILTQLPPMKTR